MPVRNAGVYLYPAVKSILAQTHQRLELIIIDDHSSDQSIERVCAHCSDTRISVIKAPQRGIINALNLGVAHAQYPILARMDGDDIAEPARLEQQLMYLLQHPDIDIVGTRVRLFKDDDELGGGYALYEDWINGLCKHSQIAPQFFVESAIPHPTAMLRKSTFEALGGYQDHGWPEDYDLWCRAFLAGMRFGKPEQEVLLHWRDHGARASRQDSRYKKQGFLRCKAHYLAKYLRERRQCQQVRIWGAGPTGLKLHDYLQENSIEVMGFIDVNPKLNNRLKRNKPVDVLTDPGSLSINKQTDSMCLVAVSARGARDELKALFDKEGWREAEDYLFVA